MKDKSIETELKFKVESGNLPQLIRLLGRLGYAATQKRTYEKTVMYDNSQGLMQTTDGRVRLRVSGSRYEFSYKKPLTREGIKKEIEYEVLVSDFRRMEKILVAMEFFPTTSYERHRTTLQNKNGKVKITIDEYPFAVFLEIEGSDKDIVLLARELGFALKDNLTDPCDTLFQQWRRERNLPFKPHMLFEDYDK